MWNLWIAVCSVGILLGTSGSISAVQKKTQANRNDEKRENQRVEAARKAVRDAEEALTDDQKQDSEASRGVAEAKRRQKAAAAELKSAREQRLTAAEESLGIPMLVAEVHQHQAALDQLTKPILNTLKSQSEYKTAEAEAKAALAELQKIRGTAAASETDSSGLPRGKVLLKTTLRPVELEQSAIQADSAANAEQKRLGSAQEKVAEARRRAEAMVESSAEVKQALNQLKQADLDVDQAERQLENARKKVLAARAKLTRVQQELSGALAADKADSNKGKKPRK